MSPALTESARDGLRSVAWKRRSDVLGVFDLQGTAQPVQTLVQTVSLGGAGSFDVCVWGRRTKRLDTNKAASSPVEQEMKMLLLGKSEDPLEMAWQSLLTLGGACLYLHQSLLRRLCRSSASARCPSVIAFGRSCLFASSSSGQPARASSRSSLKRWATHVKLEFGLQEQPKTKPRHANRA